MSSDSSRNEYICRINKALDYIHTNLYSEITLKQLSDEACFSSFHFHRIFKAFTGETPKEHIERLRLEKAANLLLHRKELSITDIALKCGYSSSSVFARAFKKLFSVSANEFRNSHYKKDSNKNRESVFLQRENSFDLKKIEIKRMGPFHLAFTRYSGDYGKSIDKAWSNLFRWANPRELIRPDTIRLGIPLDNPGITPRDFCRYNACITVPEEIKPEGPVSLMDLPVIRYAVFPFSGQSEDIPGAYEALYGFWLPDSGFIPDNFPNIEVYPPELAEGNRTFLKYDICIPVRPLSL